VEGATIVRSQVVRLSTEKPCPAGEVGDVVVAGTAPPGKISLAMNA